MVAGVSLAPIQAAGERISAEDPLIDKKLKSICRGC
jgi:hypothetical protein